jgi:hypothetical protein
MFIIADRVKETSTSLGSGDIVLNGPYGAFQTFASSIGDGDNTYYTIENNSRWEVGQGTFDGLTNSLSRDIVFDSSEGGEKINLEGVSTVFCTLPASKAFLKDPDNNVSVNSLIASGTVNSSGLVVHNVYASGDSNFIGKVNLNNDLLSSGDFRILGDVIIYGDTYTSDIVNSGFLTLVRPNSAGNFFHAYKNDGINQTVALYIDSNSSPLWRLGLKTNPSNTSASPTFGYIFGRDGSVGQVSNTNNYFSTSDTIGFTVQHDAHNVFRASSNTGVYIETKGSTYPTFVVTGPISHSEDLQRWNRYDDTTLSVVDQNGRFGILTNNPIYDLDVNGSGRLKSVTVTSGVYFPDGTFQDTAGTVNISGVSGIAIQRTGNNVRISANIPSGGLSNQILYKVSDDSDLLAWADTSGVLTGNPDSIAFFDSSGNLSQSSSLTFIQDDNQLYVSGQVNINTDPQASGYVFSVADASGLVAIEYNNSGELRLGEFASRTTIFNNQLRNPSFTYVSGLLTRIDYENLDYKTFSYNAGGSLVSLIYTTPTFIESKDFVYYDNGLLSGIIYT